MIQKLKQTNLFRYSPTHLSQNTFTCWLLSHATAEGWDDDPAVRACAIQFIERILQSQGRTWNDRMRISDIDNQYHDSNALLQISDLFIIIGDKIFQGSQISRCRSMLAEEKGIPPEQIICVCRRIEEQPLPEKNADFEFTREMLLELFRPFRNKITSSIFTDYLDYLEWIDSEVNSYRCLPIDQWNDRAYIGLFKELCASMLRDEKKSWGYIDSQNGGFMGLWWYDILSEDNYRKMGFEKNCSDEIYLQIEKNQIFVKYRMETTDRPASHYSASVHAGLNNLFQQIFGDDFKENPFRPGTVITIGYMEYNEKNCHQKLQSLHDALTAQNESIL